MQPCSRATEPLNHNRLLDENNNTTITNEHGRRTPRVAGQSQTAKNMQGAQSQKSGRKGGEKQQKWNKNLLKMRAKSTWEFSQPPPMWSAFWSFGPCSLRRAPCALRLGCCVEGCVRFEFCAFCLPRWRSPFLSFYFFGVCAAHQTPVQYGRGRAAHTHLCACVCMSTRVVARVLTQVLAVCVWFLLLFAHIISLVKSWLVASAFELPQLVGSCLACFFCSALPLSLSFALSLSFSFLFFCNTRPAMCCIRNWAQITAGLPLYPSLSV